MPSYNADNERIKRQYFAYLAEAQGHSEQTIDAVAKAGVHGLPTARIVPGRTARISCARHRVLAGDRGRGAARSPWARSDSVITAAKQIGGPDLRARHASSSDVRFAPKSRQIADLSICPLCAKSGHGGKPRLRQTITYAAATIVKRLARARPL